MANKTKHSGYFSGCLGLLIIGMINTLILFLVIKLFFDIDLTTFLNYLKNVSANLKIKNGRHESVYHFLSLHALQ